MNLTRARTVLLAAVLIGLPIVAYTLMEWFAPRSGSVWPP